MPTPPKDHDYPRSGPLWAWLGRRVCALGGWEVVGELPPGSRAVVITAPHTSNWDGLWAIAGTAAFGVHVSIGAKKGLFRWPFGGLMRWFGLFPIDRSGGKGLVEQLAERLQSDSATVLALAPEGSRSLRPAWKSGFYHIAVTAQVPLVCSFLDYGRRRLGMGLSFVPTGDVTADMDRIRAFYATTQGKHPELMGPIRLREEGDATEPGTLGPTAG